MDKADPIVVIELDPARWIRGGSNASTLLNSAGRMCCMGFAALAFGASEEEIAEQVFWGACKNSRLAERDGSADFIKARFELVYRINDAEDVSDGERLKALNEELARLGENFRFKLKD